MSIGGSSQTVKQVEKPWKEAQPYLQEVMSEAQRLYKSDVGSNYYPFATVAAPSNETNTAMAMIRDRALGGSPLLDQATAQVNALMAGDQGQNPANQYLTGTASGSYLEANPWLDRTFDRAADRVADRVNGEAGLRGRTGSGAHQNILTSQLSDLATDIYGQNYQLERDRQLAASRDLQAAYETDLARRLATISAAQELAMQPYKDAEALGLVGASLDQRAQENLDEQMNRYDYEELAPWSKLGQYNAILSGMGSLGGTKRTTTTQSSNPIGALFSFLGGL